MIVTIVDFSEERNGLAKTQVKGFFSRLAAARRRRVNGDIDLNDAYAEEEEEEREKLLTDIA